MSKKATATDAQLIMQLYDLRREAEMRKARSWWVNEFWPQSADDFMKVGGAMGSQENNWLRQVGGYWSMAAAFVLQGALSEELFIQPAVSGEMFLVFGKVHPFLKELREKTGDPHMFENIEKVITGSKFGRERLKLTLKRLETCVRRGLWGRPARDVDAAEEQVELLSTDSRGRRVPTWGSALEYFPFATARLRHRVICYPRPLCG